MIRRTPGFPTITALLSTLTVALWLLPGAADALQFDRAALASGKLWRLVTGHFTHWTTSHLGWDLVAFALLGALVERRSRGLLVATLGTSALAISVGVWLFRPDLATYRGLSGVGSALFAAVIATQIIQGLSNRSRSHLAMSIAAGIGFLVKLRLEAGAPAPLFVAASTAFVPVPLAHGVGAACGLIVCVIMFTRDVPTRTGSLAVE